MAIRRGRHNPGFQHRGIIPVSREFIYFQNSFLCFFTVMHIKWMSGFPILAMLLLDLTQEGLLSVSLAHKNTSHWLANSNLSPPISKYSRTPSSPNYYLNRSLQSCIWTDLSTYGISHSYFFNFPCFREPLVPVQFWDAFEIDIPSTILSCSILNAVKYQLLLYSAILLW